MTQAMIDAAMALATPPIQKARTKEYCQCCGAEPGIPHHDDDYRRTHQNKLVTLHIMRPAPDVGKRRRVCMLCRDGAYALRKQKESCPKCGQSVARGKAFIDQGTGAESGRTFYYCSERCRETH